MASHGRMRQAPHKRGHLWRKLAHAMTCSCQTERCGCYDFWADSLIVIHFLEVLPHRYDDVP